METADEMPRELRWQPYEMSRTCGSARSESQDTYRFGDTDYFIKVFTNALIHKSVRHVTGHECQLYIATGAPGWATLKTRAIVTLHGDAAAAVLLRVHKYTTREGKQPVPYDYELLAHTTVETKGTDGVHLSVSGPGSHDATRLWAAKLMAADWSLPERQAEREAAKQLAAARERKNRREALQARQRELAARQAELDEDAELDRLEQELAQRERELQSPHPQPHGPRTRGLSITGDENV